MTFSDTASARPGRALAGALARLAGSAAAPIRTFLDRLDKAAA